MSIGALIGGALAGAGGFFLGGATWAYYGAMLGFGIGMMLDPMMPDTDGIGSPDPEVAVMSSEVGTPVADLAGTAKIPGHLICYGAERNEKIEIDTASKGLPGGGQSQFAGYDYYMSMVLGICACPGDTYVQRLYAIYKNDDIDPVWPVFETQAEIDGWEGLECPASGGEETFTIDNVGTCTFYFGTDDQAANTDIGALLDDDTLNTPYRNLCYAFMNDVYIGKYNRSPTYKFIIKKIPENDFSALDTIQTYDVNPMHAAWYALSGLGGLPETWLDSSDFGIAATTLYYESRGISCLFDKQQSVLSYLETINNHCDGIIRYGSDSEFHPKLIRDDYDTSTIPSINEDDMLDDPTINRPSWIDTLNEIKVQYSKIINAGRAKPIFGILYATGSNASGQIGDGTTANRNTFSVVSNVEDEKWAKASCGSASSGVLKSDGTLWATGNGTDGKLGQGDEVNHTSFQQIISPGGLWVDMDHSSFNTYGIRHDKTLWICGYNPYGQCAQDDSAIPIGTREKKLTMVQESQGFGWIKVVAGRQGSVAIRKDNTEKYTLYFTGQHSGWGALGLSTPKYKYTKEYSGAVGWTDIEFDGLTCFAAKSGTWYATGYNKYGQMGIGTWTTSYSTWQYVGLFETIKLGYSYGSSEFHAVGLKSNGTLWATGDNYYGQLGQGDTTDRNTWTQIGSATNWTEAWAGMASTMALNSDGEIWVCGRGSMLSGSGNRTGGPSQTSTMTRESTNGTFTKIFTGIDNNSSYALKS